MSQETKTGKATKHNFSMGRVVIIGGAFIGLLIGSGFATGQEIMQYFVSYGYMGIAGAIGIMFLLAFVGIGFISVGNAEKFDKGIEVYEYFSGPYLGKFYDIFSSFFVYLSYIIMIAGSAATGKQQFGLPLWVGGLGMMVVATLSVLLGLKKFTNIIGTLMPIVVIASFALSILTLIPNAANIATNIEMIPNLVADGTIKQASNNWWMAGLSYVGFCMLWLAAFLAETGKTAISQTEAKSGAAFGAVAFSASVIILSIALISQVNVVLGSPIPSLVLANNINPLFGNFYSLMLFFGIYSTSVPLLWNPAARFSEQGTPKFRWLVIVLGLIGGIIGLKLDFTSLVNVVYVFNGYVGVLLLVIMMIHFIRYKGFLKSSSKAKLSK